MLGTEIFPIASTIGSNGGSTYTSRTISPATPLFAVSFIAQDTQLSAIAIYLGAASGSPVLSAYIVPTDGATGFSSAPNTSPIANALASVLNVSCSIGINNFTGFSGHTLTVGAEYWIVFKFISGTSCAAFFSAAGFLFSPVSAKTSIMNGCRWEATSATEPVTWSNNGQYFYPTFIGFTYTSGKVVSFPATVLGAGNAATADRICHTNSSVWQGIGQRYVLSLTQWCNVVGFAITLRKVAVGVVGALYVDAYINGVKVATSNSVPASLTTTSSFVGIFEFPRSIKVQPGASITFIITSEENTADTPSSNYTYTYLMAFVDSPSVRANLPCGGRMWKVNWNGATNVFTESTTTLLQAAVLLDGTSPFIPAPLNRRKYFNQR